MGLRVCMGGMSVRTDFKCSVIKKFDFTSSGET